MKDLVGEILQHRLVLVRPSHHPELPSRSYLRICSREARGSLRSGLGTQSKPRASLDTAGNRWLLPSLLVQVSTFLDVPGTDHEQRVQPSKVSLLLSSLVCHLDAVFASGFCAFCGLQLANHLSPCTRRPECSGTLAAYTFLTKTS